MESPRARAIPSTAAGDFDFPRARSAFRLSHAELGNSVPTKATRAGTAASPRAPSRSTAARRTGSGTSAPSAPIRARTASSPPAAPRQPAAATPSLSFSERRNPATAGGAFFSAASAPSTVAREEGSSPSISAKRPSASAAWSPARARTAPRRTIPSASRGFSRRGGTTSSRGNFENTTSTARYSSPSFVPTRSSARARAGFPSATSRSRAMGTMTRLSPTSQRQETAHSFSRSSTVFPSAPATVPSRSTSARAFSSVMEVVPGSPLPPAATSASGRSMPAPTMEEVHAAPSRVRSV